MKREEFEEHFLLNFELLDVLVSNRSAIDSKSFLGQAENRDQVLRFMKGYGVDSDNPIETAELFGVFQESLQFIRRHFLREGRPEGLDLIIPSEIAHLFDVSQLFILSTEFYRDHSNETENSSLRLLKLS